jgi:hypothetical protein
MILTSHKTLSASRRDVTWEILATIAAVIVGAWAGDAITNFLHQRWVDSEIKKELVESSESMNKTLPKMLDSITRLDTTTIVQEPHVFNYHYTLMLNPDLPMDRNKFSNIMRSNLTKTYRESDGDLPPEAGHLKSVVRTGC